MKRTLIAAAITIAIAALLIAAPPATQPAKVDVDDPDLSAQPDYAAWEKLREGMTELDVIELLGRPWRRDELNDIWHYGPTTPDSPEFPEPMTFTLIFNNKKLAFWDDPFNGNFSSDGKPTVPIPATPSDQSVFDHYPRYLDFRWTPASGRYPMRYEVEVQAQLPRTGEWYHPTLERTDRPYLCDTFVGSQPGRWRVRAVNALGASEWSAYRHFTFKR